MKPRQKQPNPQRQQKLARARKGAALVELVVCLPALFLIVFGTIEACSMIYLNQSLRIAAYEGARVALIPNSTVGNVEAACNQIVNDRNVQGVSVLVTPSSFETMPYGTYVAVNVTAPCEANSLFGTWFYGGREISVTVEMMKEA